MLKLKAFTFPTLPDDREYMVIGPNCWGRDRDPLVAEKRAQQNGSSTGWKFILYDVPKGAWLDEMGFQIEWKTPEGAKSVEGIREILRFEPKSKK